MKAVTENGRLIIYLDPIINTTNSAEKERELISILDANPGVIPTMDASETTYISSAGLRVLMKVRKRLGQPYEIREVSQEVYDIFTATGFDEVLHLIKKLRTIDISGCEVIGQGFFGTVYRLNEDTIVKVYDSAESIAMIVNEKLMAKMAFLKGIPTAIAYDIVRVGNSYGSVFELLNAKTFNDLIISDPDHTDEITDRYTDFLKTVHQTEMDEGSLPSCSDVFLDHLDQIRDYLDSDIYQKLKELFSSMPHDLHVVHGDCQMKNVMLTEDEPMLIDMDTLSVGHPIFDLQGLYVTYMAFSEDEPDNTEHFLGISRDTSERIWDRILHRYLSDRDESAIDSALQKIRIVAYVRFLYIVTTSVDLRDSELGKKRIEHSNAHLRELLPQVDTLIF